MKLSILRYGDPILRAKGKRIENIDNRIRELAKNMLETMHVANGIGLAAQQVGEALQLTVLDISQVEDRPSTMKLNGKDVDPKSAMPLILINPELELRAETESGVEGCLSFPEITGEIERPESVRVRAQTLDGEIEFEAGGLLARALQHEVDHLNGILFIDRMSSAAKAALASQLKRLQKATKRGERVRVPAAAGPSSGGQDRQLEPSETAL
jgi:peptide deformylase